jgi:hypothetical protein
MAKGKSGLKFTIRELESLVETIEELVPIGNTKWERVWDRHVALYPEQDRTVESLKRKFQEMARAKIKTGDPNMPPHIRGAKRAYFAIVKKTDGSTGGGSDDSFLEAVDDDSNVGEEESEDGAGEWGEVGGKGGDFLGGRGEDVAVNTTRGGKLGTSLGVVPTNLFPQVVAGVDGLNGSVVNVDGADDFVGVAATASTASSSHITTSSGGGKRASDASLGEGQKKKSKAFTQPLQIARKSSSNAGDDGNEGSHLGNVMYMMMMQHKSDSEQREREYQLRREEMAIAREEARDQRQMMNLLFMQMLNRNGGGDSNQPPSPSPKNT